MWSCPMDCWTYTNKQTGKLANGIGFQKKAGNKPLRY